MRPLDSSVVSRTSAGFTLLEMLVVLAILGLAAALALPTLRRPPDNLRLEAAARTAVDEAGSLGARFLVATDGTPYQELGPAEWSFEVLDMSERPDPDAAAVAL